MVRALPFIALLLAAVALTSGIAAAPLLDPVEAGPAVAAARAAGETGVPRADGPPLWLWAAVGSVRTAGPNEAAVRLPSALAGLACAVIVLRTGAFAFGTTTGAMATLLLISMPLFSIAARVATPDAAVAAATLGALAAAFGAADAEGEGRPHRVPAPTFWASCGLALLAGGPVALALPILSLLLYMALAGERNALRAIVDPPGMIAFIAAAIGGIFVGAWRVPPAVPGADVAWPLVLLPWGVLLPAAVVRARRTVEAGTTPTARRARLFFFGAAVAAAFLAAIVPAQARTLAVATAPLAAILFADGATGLRSPRTVATFCFAAAIGLGVVAALAAFMAMAPDMVLSGEVPLPRAIPLVLLTPIAAGLAALAVGAAAGGVLADRGRPVYAPIPFGVALAGVLAVVPYAGAPAIGAVSPRRAVAEARRGLRPEDIVIAYRTLPPSVPFYLGRVPRTFTDAPKDREDLEIQWRNLARVVALMQGDDALAAFLGIVGERRVDTPARVGRYVVVESRPPDDEPVWSAPPPAVLPPPAPPPTPPPAPVRSPPAAPPPAPAPGAPPPEVPKAQPPAPPPPAPPKR